MTRVGLICLLTVCWLGACESKERPEGVLSREEYAAWLIDVYLAEARLATQPRDSASPLFFSFEKKLQQRHGLSDSVLKHTYQYYLNHPDQLEQVYVAVVDSLSLREQRYKRTGQ
jgi:hypothetical protein